MNDVCLVKRSRINYRLASTHKRAIPTRLRSWDTRAASGY